MAMKMFMFKSFCIAALMFISVLAGMQMANNGIHKMKGYSDPNFQGAVTINKEEGLNASVLGQDLTSHDIEAKKKKLEEMSAYNFFSSMGKKLSDGVTKASEKVVQKISQ
jgi:hypothetical protein